VPVYNVENYLHECLDSIVTQTYLDYECILIDDGSTDNSPNICNEYADKYFNFSVIHKENGGLSEARNTGIKKSSGDFIILLDSDDLFSEKTALQSLCKTIESTDAPVVFNSNLKTILENDNNIMYYDGINENKAYCSSFEFCKMTFFNPNSLLAGWLFSVRRDFLLEHDLFFKEGIFHEDEHWMPRVICSTEILGINHDPFYTYRKGRPGSIMSNINPKRLLDKILIIREISSWIDSKLYSRECIKILKWRMAQIWYGIFCQAKNIKKEKDTQYDIVKKELSKTKIFLLGGRGIKYVFFYILISVIGI
jgi:glycosyltransferase involved in cell wall biosynthesis